MITLAKCVALRKIILDHIRCALSFRFLFADRMKLQFDTIASAVELILRLRTS